MTETVRLSELPSEKNTAKLSSIVNEGPLTLSELNGDPKVQVTGEMRPITGFWGNLNLPWRSWKSVIQGDNRLKGPITEHNFTINLVRLLTGETTQKKEHKRYIDKLQREIDAQEDEGVSLGAIKDAFEADPGAFTAEFVNAMAANPELLAVPLGWRTAAGKTAAMMKTSGTVQRTLAANLAGAGGAATTASAIVAPASIADQLDKTGTVNWARVGEETALAAGLAVMLGSVGAKRFSAEKAREIVESTVGSAQTQAVARTPIADAVAEVVENFRNSNTGQAGRWFLDKTGAKSITRLDDAARFSATLKKLRNDIEYKEFATETSPRFSHFERVYYKTGEYVQRLQDIMRLTKTPLLGRIKKADNDTIVQGLRGGKMNPVSRALRGLLDDVRQYAIDAGLDVGEIANYFPRIYNVRKLKKNENAFIKALTDNGVDAGVADDIYRRIIDNDGVLDDTRRLDRIDIFGRPTARAKNLERSRPLKDVPDEALAPFLENEAYPVIQKYIMNAVKRAEFAKTFGRGGQKLNNQLKTAMEEMRAAGRPMRKHELDRVYDIADAIQGMYRPFEMPVIAKASKIIATYELLKTLTLATLSSITEPMIILARGRLDSTLKAVPKLVRHTTASWVRALNKRFPKPEATRAVERVGLALDDSIGEVLTQTFGGEANKVTQAFFKTTLLSQWTRMNRVLGYHAGRHMIIDNLKDIQAGKGFRFERKMQELAELNVPVREGLEWLKRGMPDDEFADIVNQGAARFTNEVVMSPRVTNRPLWHSNPNMHLLAQLKGFPTVFGNTVMKRWFTKIIEEPLYHGPKVAATGAAMVMVALIVNDLRDQMKGIERDETEHERIMRAIDRTGMTGIGQMAMDAMYAHRFGSASLPQMMGPFFSQLNELFKASGEALEGDADPLRKEAAMAVPIVNQKREWRDEVEKALGEED